MHKAIVFLLQNLALQLGLGQRCLPEGIAISSSCFLPYESDVPLRLSAAPCISFARLAPRERLSKPFIMRFCNSVYKKKNQHIFVIKDITVVINAFTR